MFRIWPLLLLLYVQKLFAFGYTSVVKEVPIDGDSCLVVVDSRDVEYVLQDNLYI